jgi:hypothetical protein
MSAPVKKKPTSTDVGDALERRLSSRATDSAFDAVTSWYRPSVEGVDFEVEDGDSSDRWVLAGNNGTRYEVECEVIVTVRELPPTTPEREREPVLTTRRFHAGADIVPPDDVHGVSDRDGSEWTRCADRPDYWRCNGGIRTSWAGVLMWSPLTEVLDAPTAVAS